MPAAAPVDPRTFWRSDSGAHVEPVTRGSAEWRALQAYFDHGMPREARLLGVQRIENHSLWSRYDSHLAEIQEGFPGSAEVWLWHGADTVDHIAEGGFQIAFSNRTFNMYGVGHYFAADPRMANHFVRSTRHSPDEPRRFVLARVAAGVCKTRDPIQQHVPDCRTKKTMNCRYWKCREMRAELLRQPENQLAPPGAHSCSSKHQVEVVVYGNHHAYPAYIFKYVCTSLYGFDPYRNMHELFKFNPRGDRSTFTVQVTGKRAMVLGGLGPLGDMEYADTFTDYAQKYLPGVIWQKRECFPNNVSKELSAWPGFDIVIVCDIFVDLPRKVWNPKLDEVLRQFTSSGGLLAFLGGEPFAKDRIFKNVFRLPWKMHGEVGGDCVRSEMLEVRFPHMASAPVRLRDNGKLLPVKGVPPADRVYVLERDDDSDWLSSNSDASSLGEQPESDVCGIALATHNLGAIVNVGEMRYPDPEDVAKGVRISWWDALLCLVKGHRERPPLPEALTICFMQGSVNVDDGGDARAIRMEAFVDEAFDAVMDEDSTKLRNILAYACPDLTAPHGFTLLMNAAQTGDVDKMRLLLEKRADINKCDEDNGWTALHYLADSKYANGDAFRFLVDAGADPQLRSKFGDTPLDIAQDNRRLQL